MATNLTGLVTHTWEGQGGKCGGQEQPAGVQKRGAMIPDMRKETKEDSAKGGGYAADIVAKSSPGRPQQGGKERGQVHRKQSKGALTKANGRQPAKQCRMIASGSIGA